MNIKDSVITDIATLIGKGDEVSKKESAILSILKVSIVSLVIPLSARGKIYFKLQRTRL